MRATASTGPGTVHSGAGQPETIRFPVSGMTCASCIVEVTRSLKRVPGVDRVRVDLGREVAIVRRLPTLASDAALEQAVAEAGYEARLADAEIVDSRETAGPLGRLLRRLS